MLSHDVHRIQHRPVRRGSEECVSLDTQYFADQHLASSRGFCCRLLRLDSHAQPGNRLSAARHLISQEAPFAQRLRQRAAVDVLEFAADGYTTREPRDLELA